MNAMLKHHLTSKRNSEMYVEHIYLVKLLIQIKFVKYMAQGKSVTKYGLFGLVYDHRPSSILMSH